MPSSTSLDRTLATWLLQMVKRTHFYCCAGTQAKNRRYMIILAMVVGWRSCRVMSGNVAIIKSCDAFLMKVFMKASWDTLPIPWAITKWEILRTNHLLHFTCMHHLFNNAASGAAVMHTIHHTPLLITTLSMDSWLQIEFNSDWLNKT